MSEFTLWFCYSAKGSNVQENPNSNFFVLGNVDASIDNLSVSNILLGKNHFCIWLRGAGKYCSSILKILSILSNKSQELIRPSILSNS